MGLTLADLKKMVDDMVEERGGMDYAEEVEVRWAAQPNWPFEYSIDSEALVFSEDNTTVFFHVIESQ